MQVTKLPHPLFDKSETLKIIDSLRAAVESGQIKSFAAVGIEPDGNTLLWTSCVQHTTRLEVIGAIAHLLTQYSTGEV